MRASIIASVLAAAAVCGGLLLAVWLVLRPAGAALRSAEFSSATLTPDADGLDDVLRIRYELARPALVSIFLLDAAGTRFTFRSASQRRHKPRQMAARSAHLRPNRRDRNLPHHFTFNTRAYSETARSPYASQVKRCACASAAVAMRWRSASC